jgi:hypothetical protein
MYASMTKKEYMSYIGSMSMINGTFYSIIEGVADNSSPLCVHFPLFSSESAILAYSHNNQIANVPQCNPSGLYPTAAPPQPVRTPCRRHPLTSGTATRWTAR